MDNKVCARDSRLKRKPVLLEKRLKGATNTFISHASKRPRDVQSATSFPYSSSIGMPPQKQARLNRRLILSRKRNSSRVANANGENIRGVCAKAWDFGPPTDSCKYYNATMWKEERSTKGKKTKEPVFSLCCSEGKVRLPLLKKAPPTLDRLLDFNGSTLATYYQNNMRAFNAMFAFTSMGGNIDYSTADGQGPYNFRLNGHNYHRIGSLLPPEGHNPHFAQLYIHDTQNEVANRVGTLHHVESSSNSEIVDILVKMLEENNVLVRSFRMARDRFTEANVRPLELCLLGNRTTDGRQYHIPSASEVAAVIVGDIRLETGERDIIVEERGLGLKHISPVHPSYMAKQYPLLFPYGEDGFRPGIKHTNVTGAIKEKDTFVSIREYYTFRIQRRLNEGDTLLRGRRLFQQFVVDAYTSIEGARLLWVKNNQK